MAETKEEKMEMWSDLLKTKEAFDRIGRAVSKYGCFGKSITLDCFVAKSGETCAYVVIQWDKLAVAVENASDNSLSADIRTMAEMLNGGHYAQVNCYQQEKDGSVPVAAALAMARCNL